MDRYKEESSSPKAEGLIMYLGMGGIGGLEMNDRPFQVLPGDRILLCSDGLYGMVPEKNIARILRSSRSPERVCRRLVDKANENGGRDNISAVYIKIE